MPDFYYQGKARTGEGVSGVIEAFDEESAAQTLRDKNYIIFSLVKKEKQNIVDQIFNSLNRVRSKDLVFFAHQLATLVSASVPLVRALKTLVRQTDNYYLKIVVGEIALDINEGMKLSQSLAQYPNIFDNFFVSMVRAGETTGRLDKVLEYLADQKEKDYTLLARIRGALVYPAFILTTIIVVGSLMMAYVLPQLTKVFKEMNVVLPWPTLVLMSISDFFQNFWWLVLVAILIIVVIVYYLQTLSEIGMQFDIVKFHIPILGPILQKVYFVRFSRSLASLITAGVPIVQGLQISGEIVGNKFYRQLILDTAKAVETGQSIISVFSKSKYIPPLLNNMISIGEETGRLDQVLNRVADFYNGELDRDIASLVSLVEPFIIIFLGIVVALLIAGIILPIYNLTSTLYI